MTAATAETGRPAAHERELVSTSISRQPSETGTLKTSFKALRVTKPCNSSSDQTPPDRSGTTIQGFSTKSRSRLRILAENSAVPLISQFGLTYHNEWPVDGRLAKRHLDNFLRQLRRLVPDIGYLWLLEFQRRNAPHFHIFLTIPPTEELRLKLAAAWCQITSPNDPEALRFHQDQRNWIDWDMFSSGYLTKYLDKDAQKSIPEGYYNFGRFWGNSRNIAVPWLEQSEETLDLLSVIDEETGEIYGGKETVLRWLGRLAERQTKGYSRFRKRVAHGSYTMRNGVKAYNQIERYFSELNRRKELNDVPF